MANAQVIVSPTGMADEIGMQAEGMSPDASSYVAGSNQFSFSPAIWTIGGDVKEYAYAGVFYPSLYDEETWEFIGYDYDNPQEDPYQGSFHAVTNSGIAVGEFGSSFEGAGYACKASIDADTVVWLYSDHETESGSSAYAISEDGNTIAGFYYAGYVAQACIWKNGGLTAADRVDLPAPTVDEFGGPIDYVSARWMSADASVILGYAQDYISGSWVMIYWTANQDGSYTVHANHAKQYFTAFDWDIMDYNHPNNPYVRFEPNGISANGEWISLTVTPKYDLNDFNDTPMLQAARLHLTDNSLEVLDLGEYDAPIFFGIANDGTCAGASEAGFAPMAPAKKVNGPARGEALSTVRAGYVWPAGQNAIYALTDIFAGEEYFDYDEMTGEGVISAISADATKIVGYVQKTDGDNWQVTSYVATLPELKSAIQHVENAVKGMKVIENGQVVIIREGVRYNMMGQKF